MYGRVEEGEWKGGRRRMEGWKRKRGRVEEWKSGRIEEGEDGRGESGGVKKTEYGRITVIEPFQEIFNDNQNKSTRSY